MLSLTPRERANLDSHEAKNARPHALDEKALRRAFDTDPSVTYMVRKCNINASTASKYVMFFQAQDRNQRRSPNWKDVYEAFREVR